MSSDFSKLPKEEREVRLTALALGELAPAEAEGIHQAVAADAELAREFERIQQTIELVRETAAMDRRVSPGGLPLKLDDTRRQKLLEAFKTPARAPVPRRRKKLWFVPMSAAAAIIGLLIAAMAFPHMRSAGRMDEFTMLSADAPRGIVGGLAFRNFRERLPAQRPAPTEVDGRAQDFITLADIAATETPAPRPEPLLTSPKSFALALPAGGDKDGDGLADPGGKLLGREFDLSAFGKSAEAWSEFSTSGRHISVPVNEGMVANQDINAQKTSPQGENRFVGRTAYLGNEGKIEAVEESTRSPQKIPPVNSLTVNEVMYDSDPASPSLVQAGGAVDKMGVRPGSMEFKSHIVTRDTGGPINSSPGDATALGLLIRPAGTLTPATPPPANTPEQAGATVYSVDAVGYVNLNPKAAYNLIPNPTAGAGDSVERNKAAGSEAKSLSDVNAQSAFGGFKAQDNGTIAGSSTVTVSPPTPTGSQPLPENSASPFGTRFYRLLPESDAGMALNNNGDSDAFRAVPLFKIEAESSGQAVANGTVYVDLNKNRSLMEAARPGAEQAWVSGSVGARGGSAPTFGMGGGGGLPVVSTPARPSGGGGGGGADYAQASIAGGGGRGDGVQVNGASGNLLSGTFGNNAGQPAKPETQVANENIDLFSNAGEIVAVVPQRLTVDAKFMDVKPDDLRALSFDSPHGKAASQTIPVDMAVQSTNSYYFRDHFADVSAGLPIRSDDGAVAFPNNTEVVRTNALVSNQNWGLAGNSSWFGKDGKEKLPADADDFSVGVNGVAPALNYRWRMNGEKPASGEDAFSTGSGASGSIVVLDGSFVATHNLQTLSFAEDTVSALAEFPATAGGKTFGAKQSGLGSAVAPRGLASVTASSVGQSRQGGRAAGGTESAARGFYDDNVNTAPTGERSQIANDVAVRRSVTVQLPGVVDQQSRQALPEEQLWHTAKNPRSVKGILPGVDAAGLPIADGEAQEKKLDQVALRSEGVIAENKLEKKNALASAVETGKPMLRGGLKVPVNFAKSSAIMMATNGVATSGISAGSTAVPELPREEKRLAPLAVPQSFARTNMVSNAQVSARITDHEKAGEPPRPIVDRAPAKPPLPAATPQPEVLTRENAFSTFSLNVSDVSFKLAAASLEKGAMPEVANIRSEEFINAFDYRDPMPAPGAPMAFAWERARYPFAHNRDVLRFSVKTAAQGREAGKPLNIVLLLDNSGSMERADRVRIIQESLRTLAAQLKPQDKISVVTFSRTARLWADGVPGRTGRRSREQISELTPEGGTNLEDALDLAYRTALRHYAATAVNRVVLLTDGAANLGNVEPKELKEKVESFRKQGIALDCFGIGWEGFNDDLLEQLSRNGDGRYGFVNTPEEAASEFVGQLAGALRVAASDVKMQVEFNPKRVTAYRQIGYAKHQLTKEQFRDNKVDAAEIGAAESGNALYVIETNPHGEGPIATVRARFRVPQTSDYREHEWVVPFGSAVELEQVEPIVASRGQCFGLFGMARRQSFRRRSHDGPFARNSVRRSRNLRRRSAPEETGVDDPPGEEHFGKMI